ncbi:MAG: translocase FtsK protein [Parcubacteria group bacterium GW2011_GWA2_42_14]|nr:MAG: translocase FtsK protein [Parcubacteria group bacterium GW2011_GWA2_42_14]
MEVGKPWHEDLHPETKKSVLAIVFFSLTVLTLLSYWGKAGFVGQFFFEILLWLFGNGFFLAPLTFALIGFSFLFSFRRHIYAATLVGGFLFLVSSLGVIDLVLGNQAGGHIGRFVTYPLFMLFDFWATLTIEAALFIAALLIMLNIPMLWFGRKVEESESSSAEATEDKEKTKELAGVIKDVMTEAVKAVKGDTMAGSVEAQKTIMLDEKTKGEEKFSFEKKRPGAAPYKKPPLAILNNDKGTPSSGDIRANANIIKRTLQNFGIEVEMDEVSVGPTVTQYTLKPAEGVKLSRIEALHKDLSLALAAHPIRIEAPIPGKSLVGIEVPNRSIALVGLRSLFEQAAFQESQGPLIFVLGRDVAGEPVYANLAKMPHLLIAGSTGSGKSVAIHSILTSFLFRNSPDTLKLILIDPKRVEQAMYNGIPHLLSPVITDYKKAIHALRWAVHEMDKRYELLSQEKTRDILSYNAKISQVQNTDKEILPYIVIVVDELADLMVAYPREVEGSIIRLAQMARAVGLHLIVSTQRPSVEVITGLIKANITSRIAFQVASQVDSRTILDMGGAEKLLGNGDMLFLAGDIAKPRRIQGAFVSETEVKKTVEFLKNESGEEPEYAEDIFSPITSVSSPDSQINFEDFDSDVDDELYEEAEKLVIEANKASASYLQRRLKIGYARAARLLDMLEENGIIGQGAGAKPREILVRKEDGVA